MWECLRNGRALPCCCRTGSTGPFSVCPDHSEAYRIFVLRQCLVHRHDLPELPPELGCSQGSIPMWVEQALRVALLGLQWRNPKLTMRALHHILLDCSRNTVLSHDACIYTLVWSFLMLNGCREPVPACKALQGLFWHSDDHGKRPSDEVLWGRTPLILHCAFILACSSTSLQEPEPAEESLHGVRAVVGVDLVDAQRQP